MAAADIAWCESFGWLTTASKLARKYTSIGTGTSIEVGAGPNGENALQFTTDAQVWQCSFTLTDKAGIHFDFKQGSSTGLIAIFVARQSSSNAQCSLYLDQDTGVISVRRWYNNGFTVTGGSSASGVIRPGVWHNIELVWESTSSAAFECWVDGVSVFSGTAQNLQNQATSGIDELLWFFDGSITNSQICNVIMQTGASSSQLTSHQVSCLLPDANGASTDLTPLAGDNYAAVDDADPDDDTTYVESGTAGHKDTLSLTTLGATTVLAVATNIDAKRTEAGTQAVKPAMRIGGGNYVGTSVNLAASYLQYQEVMTVDPATSLAWEVSDINASEFGYEVQ